MIPILLLLLLSPPTMASSLDEERLAHKQYKRVHQKLLRQLLRGQEEAVLQELLKLEAAAPRDPETQFLLSLTYDRLDDFKNASTHRAKAIEAGLPEERFAAGPRELISKPPPSSSPLIHGPMLGDVTATGISVWVRTETAQDVQVLYRPEDQEAVAWAASSTTRTSPKNDFTGVVRVEGLRPHTTYQYRVRVGNAELPSQAMTFQTAPPSGQNARFSFVFGGGAGFVPENERVWSNIQTLQPDFLLLLGDNVYIDDPKSEAMQNYCYYRRQSRSEFRSLGTHVPIYAIWDDHDFGTNDCYGGPDIDQPAWKPEVWDVFQRNWVNPSRDDSTDVPGCYYSFSYGEVDFIMLDGRYYRSSPKAPSPSMLGPRQKNWLFERLREAKGTFKILVSPVPWTFLAKGKSKDTWNGYRSEREEIFEFLESRRIEGVVLVSADRHRSDLWRIDREQGYPLFELGSSRLTNQHVHKEMTQAVYSYNRTQSFGEVGIDTTRADPELIYTIRTGDAEPVYSFTLRASRLRHSR